MEASQFADTYIAANRSFFPDEKLGVIRDKLINMPESRQSMVQVMPLKNPTTTLILSLLLGGLAIDRFYLGNIGLGILKIISVFFIVGVFWALLDIYFCYKKAKEINFNNLISLL